MKYYLINPKDESENLEVINNNDTYGVEVIGEYSSKVKFNLDPQHIGKENIAASRKATIISTLPNPNSVIVFSKLDMDSAAACVVLEKRIEGMNVIPEDFAIRLDYISMIDEWNFSDWHKTILPSKENKWPNGITHDYVAMSAFLSDYKIPLSERINGMKLYLEKGNIDDKYLKSTNIEREIFIKELEEGNIKIEKYDSFCLVESTSRNATIVAYANSPVGICINPEMVTPSGTIRKWTICQYKEGYIDMDKIREELRSIESGVGGSKTIIGSPMGISSNISSQEPHG